MTEATSDHARTKNLADVAFYYPGHLWYDSEYIKTLLLFFDGIALLVPKHKRDEPRAVYPVVAQPLLDNGLLHYLIADDVVDADATERMIEPILKLACDGVFDELNDSGTVFHSISRSRAGFSGDMGLAEELYAVLQDKGLAAASIDGVSINMHPQIRYLILMLLSQILRSKGTELGLELCPTTDRPKIVSGLSELLSLPQTASTGQVVAFDLQTVSVDLRSVPLDEVLDFKKTYGLEYRSYARSIRRFTREISLLPLAEREKVFLDRQSELDDAASDLKRTTRMAWKRPATFALGFAGAAWTSATGDWIGALIGGGAVLLEELGFQSNERSAYSYLLRAHDHYR